MFNGVAFIRLAGAGVAIFVNLEIWERVVVVN